MTASPSVPVRDALVLAAGNGDRFQNSSRQSKLLEPVLGTPLILRTLESAYAAGIRTAEVVVGYQADRLHRLIAARGPSGLRVHFTFNPAWHFENGVSVLAARGRLDGRRFALLMGDHLFEPATLARLIRTDASHDESLLAVDSRPAPADVADEATKVRIDEGRIVAIGKDLSDYDALDTGSFVCSPLLFAALDDSLAAGDTTLSGGIRGLAARGLMRAVDIGHASWHDIDTVADLVQAESRLVDAAEQAEPV